MVESEFYRDPDTGPRQSTPDIIRPKIQPELLMQMPQINRLFPGNGADKADRL